jgi:mono/diheme cytochrome c family protein
LKFFLFLAFVFASLSASDETFDIGENIYANACSSCHGADGKANEGADFVVNPRNLSKSLLNEKQRFWIVKMGSRHWGSYADAMPAFGGAYEDEAIKSVVRFITKKFNPDTEARVKDLYSRSEAVSSEKFAQMLKSGEKVYKRTCHLCHGESARGDGLATKNSQKPIYPYNLRKTLLSKEQMFLYAKYGGEFWGSHNGDMPSWSAKYDDYSLKSVVLYIDETFRKKDKRGFSKER